MKQNRALKPFSTKKITVDEIDKVWFGKFGFKDENKNIVIEAQYTSCGDFSCGLCPVAYQSWYRTPEGERYYEMHWGYIDENGKEKIPFKFRDARDFNQYGVAAVCDEYGEGHYLIDTRGRKLFGGRDIDVIRLYEHDRRFLEFTKGEETELCNNIGAYDTKKKKVFLEPTTGGITEWSEDVIEVYERVGFCGADFWQHYVNSEGEELYPGMLNKGFNIVEQPNRDGFSIVGIFEFIESPNGRCSDGDKSYFRKESYGVADLKGNLIVPAEYDRILEKKAGIFHCLKDEHEHIINLRKR